MSKKIYTSYAEIDKDLLILKTEKELSYQKLKLSVEETKQKFTMPALTQSVLGNVAEKLPYGIVLKWAIPKLINWLMPKK